MPKYIPDLTANVVSGERNAIINEIINISSPFATEKKKKNYL